ncbi:MAG: cation:proton antiporter subunit C [Gemmatimonadetes bacterium]|nr:cation:proton antiporter subunit C [Gemmatimonadota bacterium]MCY3944094.1 cation:proton antiporter subunit C [Gemmatimonadota bacterium]
MDLFVSHYNYWVVILLMMVGFYTLISRGNLVKKIVGLNVFQTSVFMLYISMGRIKGGTPPILVEPKGTGKGHGGADTSGGVEMMGETAAEILYSNPLPHVLILTAIVVGIAVTSVGLALAVRVKEAYGTMEEDEINRIEEEMEEAEWRRGRGEIIHEILGKFPARRALTAPSGAEADA